MPFPYFEEKRPMDDRARAGAPGHTVRLPAGDTQYELAGPPEGTPVVFVHGLSVPMFIWDPVFVALAPHRCVVRYDLFGRGFSDRPEAAYDTAFFVAQLVDLIAGLGLARPVDLVGLSMGGAIVVHMADRHPDLVRKLVLIDPAGLPFPIPAPAHLVRAPILGEMLMALFSRRVLVSGMALFGKFKIPGVQDDLLDPSLFEPYIRRYTDQMRYQGFRRALLATLRSDILHGGAAAFARVGQQNRPIQLIWGEGDQTVPFALHKQVLDVLPGAQFEPIADAGHVPFLEQPAQVIALIDRFLAG